MPLTVLDQKKVPELESAEQISAYQQQQKTKYVEEPSTIQQDQHVRLPELFKSTSQECRNPTENIKPQSSPIVQIELQSLPVDVLRKICGYLSAKEIVNLASTQTLFYGKRQKSNFNFNLLAKKRRLIEFKNCQFFSNGESHFLLINNELYAWGYNNYGQLGVGDREDKISATKINLFHLNLAPGDKIKEVIVGRGYTAYLSEKGRCFTCGYLGFHGKNIPTEISFNHLNLVPGDKIKQVIINNDGAIYITEQGRYFSNGWNKFGRLGVGVNENIIRQLAEISFNHLNLAPDDKIKQVCFGVFCTIYLTEHGRCFSCGFNRDGQLGVGDNHNKNRPIEVSFNHLNLAPGDKIKQVSLSYDYVLYLTEQGRCFSCGKNNHGQLGLSDLVNKNVPTEISFNHLHLERSDKIKQVIVLDGFNLFAAEQGRYFIIFFNSNPKIEDRLIEKSFSQLNIIFENNLQQILNRNYVTVMNVMIEQESIIDKAAPEIMRKRRELIQSILNDISQLAIFASDNTDYGINFKKILIQKLQIEPYPWIHETIFNELPKITTAKEQKYLINSLTNILYLYDCLNKSESSPDIISRQQDFVELLQKLQNDEIKDFAELKEHFRNIAVSCSSFNIAKLNNSILQLNIFEKLNASCDIRQTLLLHDKNLSQDQQEAFASLKIAADIILQALTAATKENGVAFILRNLIANTPTSSQKLKPF